MFHVAYSGIRVIRIILFVAQIKVPPGTFICATNRIYKYPNKFSGHFVMCICVFTNKTTFQTKQIRISIRRCAKEKTFAETKNGDLFICVFVYSPTKSQPYHTDTEGKFGRYISVSKRGQCPPFSSKGGQRPTKKGGIDTDRNTENPANLIPAKYRYRKNCR